MNPLQMRRAAVMWAHGRDTLEIARSLRMTDATISEASVYNRLDWIKAWAYRIRTGTEHPVLRQPLPRQNPGTGGTKHLIDDPTTQA